MHLMAGNLDEASAEHDAIVVWNALNSGSESEFKERTRLQTSWSERLAGTMSAVDPGTTNARLYFVASLTQKTRFGGAEFTVAMPSADVAALWWV